MNSTRKTRVIFFGTPDFVIPVLTILASNFDLVGVVSAPDMIEGRKRLLTPSPVSRYVSTHLPTVPLLRPDVLKDNADFLRELETLAPEIAIVAAYGRILPSDVLNLHKYGALNVHPSLLPKYRGTSPIQTALKNGDDKTGVTLIKMDEKMDHGPIVAQWEYEVKSTDTFASLHELLFNQAAERLPEIITGFITGEIAPLPQNDTQATFCKRITRDDGFFSLDTPPSPSELDRLIRAYYPWPTAWTRMSLGGEEKIVKFLPEKRIQVEGKNSMPIKDFLNGYPEKKEEIKGILGEI